MLTVALALTASDANAANLRRLSQSVGKYTATSVSERMEGHITVKARMEGHKTTPSKMEVHKMRGHTTQARMDSHNQLQMEGHKTQAKLEGARVAGTWNPFKHVGEPVASISPEAVVTTKAATMNLGARPNMQPLTRR